MSALPESIASKIEVHPSSGCWIASGKPGRYGHVKINGRSAARVVWELLVGPIEPKLVMDHREDFGCTSKACTYPGHLLPVTNFVNTTRGGAGGVAAVNIRKTHCGTCGEPYDLVNCYWYKSHRGCRACGRRRVREYKRRLREAARASEPLELRLAA